MNDNIYGIINKLYNKAGFSRKIWWFLMDGYHIKYNIFFSNIILLRLQ